jgi:hypothetical protein
MKSKKLVEDVLNLFQKTTFSLITELRRLNSRKFRNNLGLLPKKLNKR